MKILCAKNKLPWKIFHITNGFGRVYIAEAVVKRAFAEWHYESIIYSAVAVLCICRAAVCLFMLRFRADARRHCQQAPRRAVLTTFFANSIAAGSVCTRRDVCTHARLAKVIFTTARWTITFRPALHCNSITRIYFGRICLRSLSPPDPSLVAVSI